MTKIIFIRHAESDNKNKDDFNRPLTKNGTESSKKLPIYFNDISINKIYSSPYVRTIDTIKHLAIEQHIKIIIKENFKERNIGSWVDNFFEFAKKQWMNFNFKQYNGESLNDVQKRNINSLKDILIEDQDKTIIVGTHGTALCTIMNYYDKNINFNYFKSIIDKMPMFIEMNFEGSMYINFKELIFDK